MEYVGGPSLAGDGRRDWRSCLALLPLVAGNIVETLYREVRALRIYEGTSEIQHLVIAGLLLEERDA